jgi:hypothetical protein
MVRKILNHYLAGRIYDLELAVGLQRTTLPTMAPTQMLVHARAPFAPALFRPFTLRPYSWAYVAWLAFSAAVYAEALALVFRPAQLTPDDLKTGCLLGFSVMPFIFETWIGGQVSAIVCFIWALFFYCLYKNPWFRAGLALACLSRRWSRFQSWCCFAGGAGGRWRALGLGLLWRCFRLARCVDRASERGWTS